MNDSLTCYFLLLFWQMNNCADGFRTLASRYDIASQSMLDVDAGMIMVMEDFKVSVLILEHASKICVKSRYILNCIFFIRKRLDLLIFYYIIISSDSFFYIDPTLLSLLSRNKSTSYQVDHGSTVSSQRYKFRTMCIGFLQDMIKWEEEQGTDIVKQVSIYDTNNME